MTVSGGLESLHQ